MKKPGPDHSISFLSLNIERRLFEDKIKATSPNIYCDRYYIECYNFCQQYKDYFATAEATKPNQIPFATFFL